MQNLKDKNILVTGAGSWIGREIAIEMSKAGGKIALLGKTKEKLLETKEEITKQGGKAEICVVDLASAVELNTFTDKVKTRVDVIVHAASIYPRNFVQDIPNEEWGEVIETNLTSSYRLVKGLLKNIPEHENGRIIFISSVAGSVIGPRTLGAYCASKAGVDGLMKSLASELGEKGITVNSILPGNILNEGRFEVPSEMKKTMLVAIPVKRLGKPADIAKAAVFLASPDSGFINGHQLVIDGGETISNWK